METRTGEYWRLIVDDVFPALASIADSSVHSCVTSPPYYGLRNYGFPGQIGSEKTPDDFVATMVRVFDGVRRVLRDDGVLFVNLGDTYAVTGGERTYGSTDGSVGRADAPAGKRKAPNGIRAGNMLGIPWRVALAMQADGWILRSCIIWNKPSPMPESVAGWRWVQCREKVDGTGWTKETHPGENGNGKMRSNAYGTAGGTIERPGSAQFVRCPGCEKCDSNGGLILRRGGWRPTTSHEYIFMFVKSDSYFCDGDGSKEPCTGNTHSRGSGVNPKCVAGEVGVEKQNASFSAACNQIVETRNLRSVWKISSEAFKGAHFATFPTELPRRCLSAAISPGGCCSACGSQYAPIVKSARAATRPGTNSKVHHEDSSDTVGNRDPQRHTTTTRVTGYLPTCRCGAPVGRPTALDCFAGSCTTGQVAINMGCNFIGIEGNPDYADLGVKRIETPWIPVGERKKPTGKRRKRHKRQRDLF